MNDFGVIEIASAKTTNAPGWAYVPDHPPHQQSQAPLSTNRKRARAAATSGGAPLSVADVSARHEAKARREIEVLDRDNARDVQIAIPAKRGGGTGAAAAAAAKSAQARKYTPNVRKILQSQKTFANHLDDYTALVTQQEGNATTSNTPVPGAAESRSAQKQQRQTSASAKPSAKQEPEDAGMPDVDPVPIIKPDEGFPLHDFEPDNNPLLVSHLPPLPSEDTIRALLAAPPLSYLEARGTWPPNGNGLQQYPTRVFCAVCGYWGRVRCMKCGTRVCALECLEMHREECITRYGL
ncbi:hypothetical protein GGS21DRAFT_490166 [Xylaria nigripes]|nr:hypothetical protein GGS21DRAFT_490166 [Xylaria nigripes]